MTARLDRLGAAREVAQVGSVIGRGFSYGLLRAVAGLDDVPLQATLEKLAEADILLVQGLPPESDYRFKHALIQDAAYENLLKSRRQVLHRRVAETLRERFADTAAAEPEVLAHHFTQAGMTDAAIEWWGKAGDQALRRSAFQEAISHLGKAIEMADKAGEGTSVAATAPAAANQRLKIQTDLGKALMWSRGFGADESKAAFIRARDLAAAIDNATERFTIYYGLWVGNMARAEFGSAREIAEAFLRQAERGARTTDGVFARRLLGSTCLWQGDFIEAHANLVEALSIYDPERDREARFRFDQDTGAAARACLANTKWQLGEVGRARALIEEAIAHATETGHVPTLVNTYFYKAHFEIVRGDAGAARRDAQILVQLCQENALSLFAACGALQTAWASARLDGRETGATELRQALAAFTDQGNKWSVPFFQALLAEIEAQDNVEGALSRIDEALALAGETGEHWSDTFLHRIRGEILLKHAPTNSAPAEEAFLTAIAIAQQQKAKSFELRAALLLAKLYQSTGRATEAHAVLAPALEGFSPTPELPEIEEAQTLLATLAENDEVKIALARRKRQFDLQISLGNALIATHGYGAPETQAAFVKARELAGGVESPTERYAIYYGLFIGRLIRGESGGSRDIAEKFLREAANKPGSGEFGMAHRLVGLSYYFAGNFVYARAHFEIAINAFDPERDRDFAFRVGQDPAVATKAFLALTLWTLGELERARRFADQAVEHALRTGHVNTIVYTHAHKAIFEIIRRNSQRCMSHADAVLDLAEKHGLALWLSYATAQRGWASYHSANREKGRAGLSEGISRLRTQKSEMFLPFFLSLAAELELESARIDAGLSIIDTAIAEADRIGERHYDAESHRIRGEILKKRDPTNAAPAEEAFQTAIAIAQQQKARSFELRAALDLARLWHSQGKPQQARELLAPIYGWFTEGFDTRDLKEAKALLDELGS